MTHASCRRTWLKIDPTLECNLHRRRTTVFAAWNSGSEWLVSRPKRILRVSREICRRPSRIDPCWTLKQRETDLNQRPGQGFFNAGRDFEGLYIRRIDTAHATYPGWRKIRTGITNLSHVIGRNFKWGGATVWNRIIVENASRWLA